MNDLRHIAENLVVAISTALALAVAAWALRRRDD